MNVQAFQKYISRYYSSFSYYSRRPHFWEDSWTRSDRRENVTNFAFFFPVSLYISFFRNNVLFSDASVYMLLSCRADRRSFPFCTFPSSSFRNGFPLLKLPYNRRRKNSFQNLRAKKETERVSMHLQRACVSIYIYINDAEDAIVAMNGRGGLVGVCGPPVALTTFIGHKILTKFF